MNFAYTRIVLLAIYFAAAWPCGLTVDKYMAVASSAREVSLAALGVAAGDRAKMVLLNSLCYGVMNVLLCLPTIAEINTTE
ncbi:hypothetical protein P8452_19352 [Trifolium repens]|nr:hypothetical protein P8452_19352 [Trifolium repens]